MLASGCQSAQLCQQKCGQPARRGGPGYTFQRHNSTERSHWKSVESYIVISKYKSVVMSLVLFLLSPFPAEQALLPILTKPTGSSRRRHSSCSRNGLLTAVPEGGERYDPATKRTYNAGTPSSAHRRPAPQTSRQASRRGAGSPSSGIYIL